MTDHPRRRFLGATALSTAALLAGCTVSGTERRDERVSRFSVPDGESFGVVDRNGRVEIRTHDADEVELTVVKRTRRSPPNFDAVSVERGSEDGVHFVRVADRTDGFPPISVDITARVPASLPVVRAETTNGNVDVRDTTGDLVARTANGAVDVGRVDGYVTAATTNGGVTVGDVTGLDVARATNGGVDAELRAIREDATIETSNGGVDLAIAPDADLVLDASVGNGNVGASDLDFTNVQTGSRRFVGTLGEGGPTLRVRVSNGAIDVTSL